MLVVPGRDYAVGAYTGLVARRRAKQLIVCFAVHEKAHPSNATNGKIDRQDTLTLATTTTTTAARALVLPWGAPVVVLSGNVRTAMLTRSPETHG